MGFLTRIKIIINRVTRFGRILPDFLIIGVPRGGTTSLYNYLLESPNIFPALWKEISYFSDQYENGITWYQSHFPTKFMKYLKTRKNENFLTGEASPIYLYHPLAPKRIFEAIPQVKIIALLRNPIDRANSHYWQSVRKKRESLSFDEAVNKQLKDEPLSDHKAFCSEMYQNKHDEVLNQYLSSGICFDRIKRFFELFPKENILIIASEDFYDNPKMVCDDIAKFLKISKWELRKIKKYNYHLDQPKMDNLLRKKLVEFYKPYNEKLYHYLNRDFGWDK